MASTEHSSGSIDPARAAESNTANIIAIFAIFLVISLAFVGLRLYSRIIITKSKGSDDLFIVLSEVYLPCLQATINSFLDSFVVLTERAALRHNEFRALLFASTTWSGST